MTRIPRDTPRMRHMAQGSSRCGFRTPDPVRLGGASRLNVALTILIAPRLLT